MSSSENKENPIQSDLSQHKFNLFQQFFVIGLDPKLSFNLSKINFKSFPNELLSPKVISKFPCEPLHYINIPDSFVISHCFPHGLLDKIIYYKDEELNEKSKQVEEWIFSLDNLAVQDYASSLRTNKVYYNCLLFYEKIDNFKNMSNYRRKMSFKSKVIVKEENKKNILIPKVICLSSFNPLFKKAGEVLSLIKKYCDNYNFESLFDKDNFNPIENIIEEIIFNLPGLPKGHFTVRLDCGIFEGGEDLAQNNLKMSKTFNKLNNKNREIIFEEGPINKSPKELINYSLLMTFFTIQELFDIIRSIILEEPVLFFCDDIYNLTYTIEGIIALIYPLKYSHTVVAVLPEENFSFINVFYHFVYGINYKYSEELWKEKFQYLGDKQKIIIVPIEKRFPNFLNDIDKEKSSNSIIITKTSSNQTPMVMLDRLKDYKEKDKKEEIEKNHEQSRKIIKLPIHYSSKCIKRLEPLILKKFQEERNKSKRELTQKEKEKICNKEIIDNFLYFFTCILLNYQEYISIKYEKVKAPAHCKEGNEASNEKESNVFKRPEEIETKYIENDLKISEMFNIQGFISNTPALDKPFYEKFFKTQIFFNFIKKKIFPISLLDKLEILFFDEKINEKLSRESKLKKIETKFLEEKPDIISGDITIEPTKKEISNEMKEFFEKKNNCERGLNYFQYIIKDINAPERPKPTRNFSSVDENSQDGNLDNNSNDTNLSRFKFYYFVFPKLLNDGIFFKSKKKESNLDNKFIKYNSSCFYSVFEKEAIKIVNNPLMSVNYKNYSYSLNPINPPIQTYAHYVRAINKLWFQLLSKTFHCLPNDKKMFYFYQVIQFLKPNVKAIDENTLVILFNALYKYGDKNMLQEFFQLFGLLITNYTFFLFLKEKVKNVNNYIDYRSLAEKDHEIEDKFLFIINAFCTKIEEDQKDENKNLYNVCGGETLMDTSSMFNEKEKYMRFECNKEVNKIPIKQPLIVSCFYERENGLKYQINFRLISPSFIVKQNWFANTDCLDIDFMKKEYLECFLSAIFYFHEQRLLFDFLLQKRGQKKELSIENIINDINLNKKEINEEEKKDTEIKEEKDNKEEIKKDINKNILMSTNDGLDLGGLNFEFGTSPPDSNKKNKSPKKSPIKKKNTSKIDSGEFKLND